MITTKAGSSYWKRLIILVSKFINWASPCINGLYQLYLQFLRGYQLNPYDHQVFFSTFRCAKIPGIPGICRQLHHPPIPFGTSWLLGVEYVYTYICVYMYIYTYVCVYIYTRMYIHIYIYTYIHIYICIHMHTRLCTFSSTSGSFNGIDPLGRGEGGSASPPSAQHPHQGNLGTIRPWCHVVSNSSIMCHVKQK